MTSTWRQLAPHLPWEALVAVADHLIGRTFSGTGTVTADLLAAAIPAGRRGSDKAHRALAVADGGAASPPETTLRLLVRAWGLPAPAVNAPLHDERGEWLGTGDLVWRRQRVVAEYEGDHHRTDRKQWSSDIERTRLLQEAGWTVIRVTATDLHRPARLRETLQRALLGQ